MESFEKILIESGWTKRIEKRNFNFDSIEKKIGFTLPADFKYYAENYYGNENFIGNEYVCLWDIESDFEANNTEYEIVKNIQNTIGIGDNGGGEFIAIHKLENDNYEIVLCPFVGMEECDFVEIGGSFSDFLNRLKNGKNWFE